MSQKNALSESSSYKLTPQRDQIQNQHVLNLISLRCQVAGCWFWKCAFLGHPVCLHILLWVSSVMVLWLYELLLAKNTIKNWDWVSVILGIPFWNFLSWQKLSQKPKKCNYWEKTLKEMCPFWKNIEAATYLGQGNFLKGRLVPFLLLTLRPFNSDWPGVISRALTMW